MLASSNAASSRGTAQAPVLPARQAPCFGPAQRRRCRERGFAAQALGIGAEAAACRALADDGWTILARRVRTEAGEIDAVAEKDGLLAIIEIKARPTLAEAAHALTLTQRRRLAGAAEILLGSNPLWGRSGVRFDLLLVDAAWRVRRIADAFRLA